MSIYIPEEITEQKLDKMVEKTNSCIDLALDNACPLTNTKIINKNNPWLSDQLEDLRTQVTNAYKRLLINPIEGHKTRYKKLIRSYKNLCFKRKEAERKCIRESIPNEAQIAKHSKTLLGSIQPKLGTLTKDDGTNTEIGKANFDELMSKHYPSHTAAKYPNYDNGKVIKLTRLMEMYNDWINKDRVTKALSGFKAKKSPGPDGIKPNFFPFIPNSFLDQIIITYKACITLESTPALWKEAKVILSPSRVKIAITKLNHSDQYPLVTIS